jgi:hypothetical protein
VMHVLENLRLVHPTGDLTVTTPQHKKRQTDREIEGGRWSFLVGMIREKDSRVLLCSVEMTLEWRLRKQENERERKRLKERGKVRFCLVEIDLSFVSFFLSCGRTN